MATENLKVKITADANQAKAEIGKFKDSLKGVTKEGESTAKSVLKLKEAMVALVAVKVAKAMIQNAISVAAVGDAIKDNAQKVFMGTTAYQEWGYVLKQNGIEMGAMKVAMRKFSQEVATGSEALAKYGITATDVDTAFSQAIATIQGMSSETEKIAAATELFGARALELMPVLNLTSAETQNLMQSYRLLGGTMSNELIAASDTCTDSITAMKAAWGGLKNVLAAYVIPVVTKVVQWITIAIAKIRILLAAIFGIKETFGGGGKKSLPKTTGSIATNTGKTASNLKKATKHAKELRRTLMGIDELSKLAEKATAAASSTPSSGGGGSVSVPAVGDEIGSIGDFLTDDQMRKLEEFKETIEKIKGLLNGLYEIVQGIVKIALGDWAGGWELIKDGVKKCWDNLKELFPWLGKVEEGWKTIKKTFEDVVKAIETGWTNLKTWFKETIVANIHIPTWDEIKQKWEDLKAKIKEAVAGFLAKVGINIPTWDEVKAKWEEFKKNFQDILPKVDFKIPKWEDIKGAWENLKKKFGGKKVKISIKLPKWKDLKGAWENLKKKFKGWKVNLTLSIGTKLSQLRGWINSNVIGPLNNTIRDVLPNFKGIPYLHAAKGAGLTAPTPVLAGEYPGARNNPEVIAPQSLMAETMRDVNGDLVSAFAQMTRQVITAIENQDLSVKIGDETIARSAQRGNTAYYNRTGKALLTI